MPQPVMAGTCAFEITERGHGCHAATPHQGIHAIVAGSQLVQALQTVVKG
ncbi:peptidase dimerization domain-containing protein [Azotobacter chroococcum]